MKRISKKWLECSLPDFGQLTVWLLIWFALCLACLGPPHQAGPRAEVSATLFAFLPEAILRSIVFYQCLRIALVVVAVGWAFQRGLPWTPWATSISFMLLWALRMENVTNGAHIFHVANMLLFLHAAWYSLFRHEISAAKSQGVFWKTRLYPRWVFYLSVFYLGIFHTWAGITKISASGFDWGNGLSLQLWIYLWGWPGSPFGQLVLASRWVARILQTGALVIESFSFLCWFGYWPRVVIGLSLLGFYSGVLGTFVDYGFHFNAILVALFLLPVENWVSARAEQRLSQVENKNSESEPPMNRVAV